MDKNKSWRDYYNPEVNKKATKKYREKHLASFNFVLNRDGDWDILAKLDSLGKGGKAGYIKQLIRDDIRRTGWRVPESPAEIAKREHDAELDAENKKFREAQEQGRLREQEEKEAALRLLGL